MIAYSDIQGGQQGIVTNNNGTVYWEEGNIDLDPLFTAPVIGDFSLQEGSPCIDTGTSFFVWEGDTLVDMDSTEYVGIAPDMGAFEFGEPVGIKDDFSDVPEEFTIFQNYPNPFNPITTIRYDMPEQAYVTLTIYDLMGREVKQLVSGRVVSGVHRVVWDGTDSFGKPVGAGLYLYRIQAGNYLQTKKMLIIK